MWAAVTYPVGLRGEAAVMQRIAVPMIGGMVSSTLLTLIVIPAIGSDQGKRAFAWDLMRIHRRGFTLPSHPALNPLTRIPDGA